ncbi:tetratricopeptide repeat protein, partial [Candidatus Omnitrophota bacterium]
YINLGMLYRTWKKYDQSEEALKKAIDIKPDDNKAYISLGRLYRHWKKYDQSEEALKKAIDIDPNDNKTYLNLGKLYRRWRKYEKAEEALKRAIDINPNDENAYINLGILYRFWRKYEQAEVVFKKVLDIDPNDNNAYINLGKLYRIWRRYEQLEEVLKRAIDMKPNNEIALGLLASSYQEQGKRDLAYEYFEKVNRLRARNYNPVTKHNYQRLREIINKRGIKLVCVQYPMLSIESLKIVLEPKYGVVFVDNEKVFKSAVEKASYDEYFCDMFGGVFGHCTPKGNRLLANNIADVIVKEHFNK